MYLATMNAGMRPVFYEYLRVCSYLGRPNLMSYPKEVIRVFDLFQLKFI